MAGYSGHDMTKTPAGKLHRLEKREPREAAHVAEMIDILRRKMERDYGAGHTRRDAHPKATGVLRGKFVVEADLPIELQVGLFATPHSHDCWVRTSNSSGKPQSDAIPDAHGIAIKLLEHHSKAAGGEKALGQDFVLLDSPVMPLGTVAMFRDAVYYTIESTPVLLAAKFAITGHAGALLGLLGLRNTPSSPLDVRYWSTTPYRFGDDHVVKYSLVPSSIYTSPKPHKPGDDYLGEAMQVHLDGHEASFDFCVQLRRAGMLVEDASVRWDERQSPFRKVATLHIPRQVFRTAKRQLMGEELAFSPGHALPDHAPLGGLNRARIKIYTALSKFRHKRDRRTSFE